MFTQRKYLIESKKLFILNTFFDLKKCFVLMKQNLFSSNKVSLNQINICSNQINFCLKSNKLYLWPYMNALIYLFWRKINLIQTNINWFKDILFESNKFYFSWTNHFFKSKIVVQTNHFLWFNEIFFLSVYNHENKKIIDRNMKQIAKNSVFFIDNYFSKW